MAARGDFSSAFTTVTRSCWTVASFDICVISGRFAWMTNRILQQHCLSHPQQDIRWQRCNSSVLTALTSN